VDHEEGDEEVQDHDQGGGADEGAEQDEDAADELGVDGEPGANFGEGETELTQEVNELLHAGTAEDVILRAVDETDADEEAEEDGAVFFVAAESAQGEGGRVHMFCSGYSLESSRCEYQERPVALCWLDARSGPGMTLMGGFGV